MLQLPLTLRPIRTLLIFLFVISIGISCKTRKPDPQMLIGEAIAAHGWQNYKRGVVSFRQENILYRVLRDGDAYLYSRTFYTPEGQRVHDVLANKGFSRTINDQEEAVGEEAEDTYSEEIRNKIFFALLPYTLKDSNMLHKYVGNVTLKGQPYHKVRVTFPASTGKLLSRKGDSYLLWIHRQRHTLDYLVYTSSEGNKGNRFCEAVNPREVGGIRFQDYNKYNTSKRISPARLDYAFEAGKLDKVSATVLEELKVSGLPAL